MERYSDIIDLPHHVSKKHKQMPIIERAAQFAPFAALVGLDEGLEERAVEELKKKENEVTFESFE